MQKWLAASIPKRIFWRTGLNFILLIPRGFPGGIFAGM
jgi:hypothetical protein